MSRLRRRRMILEFLGLLVAVSYCDGAELGAGFDLYHVRRLTVDLGPGVGRRSFEGIPITSSLGDANLIVQRGPRGDGLNLRVIALSLKSKKPLFLDGKTVDAYMTINNSKGMIAMTVLPEPDFVLDSDGALIRRQAESYRMRIEIHADLILVQAGAARSLQNFEAHKAMDPFMLTAHVTWNAYAPPRYPKSKAFSSGGHYPRKVAAAAMTLVPAERR